MTLLETFIKVIGSKWFVLLLGVGMAFAIPPCWHAVSTKPTPQDIGILIMACLTTGLAFYKFANMFFSQRKQAPQENKEW